MRLRSCRLGYIPGVRSSHQFWLLLLLSSASRLLLHGFACASCTEPGSTVNPAARTVATANTAAIKRVFFIVKESMKVYV